MIAKSITQKIAWSTFIQYVGKIVQVGLGINMVHTITGALGPENYGIYGKITEYCLFFSSVAGLGMYGNIVRALGSEPKEGHVIWNAWWVRSLSAGLILGVGTIVAFFTAHPSWFQTGVLIFMGALWIDYLSTINAAAFQANYKMGRLTIVQMSGRILEWILVHHFAKTSPDGLHFFLAQMVNATWVFGASTILLHQIVSIQGPLNKTLAKTLFLGALPLGVINILNNAYYRFLPSYFMSKLMTNAEYGRYNVLLTICGQLALISTLLMFSTLPILKQSIDEGHERRVHELLNKTSQGLLGLGLLMIVSGSILGPHLIHWVSTDHFQPIEMRQILPIMLGVTALSWLYDFVLIGLFALNQERWFIQQELLALMVGGLGMMFSQSPVGVLISACVALTWSVGRGFYKIKTESKTGFSK